MIRAPVIPNGWPRAIAPPKGLSCSSAIPSLRAHGRTWAANASLSSTMSISSIERRLLGPLRAAGASSILVLPIEHLIA